MIDDLQTKDIDFKKAYFVGDTTGDASAAISKNLKFIKDSIMITLSNT